MTQVTASESIDRAASSVDSRAAELVTGLEGARHEMRRFLTTRSMVWLAGTAAAWIVLFMAADWWLMLDTSVRGAALLLVLSAISAAAYRWVVKPWSQYRRMDAARAVEHNYPTLGQRIRTALEYAEPTEQTAPALPSLVEALEADASGRAHALDLSSAMPWRSLRLPAALVSALGCVLLCLVLVVPEMRIALARVLLIPATYTQLQVTPGDQSIKEGESVAIRTEITGRAVKQGGLFYRTLHGQEEWTELPVGGAGSGPIPAGVYENRLAECTQDIEYFVRAGRVASPTFQLKVLHPLRLQAIEVTVAPPAYTGKQQSIVKGGNYEALEGSRGSLRITLDRSPAQGTLALYPSQPGKDVPDRSEILLKVEDCYLTGEFPALKHDLDYEVQAIAADGMSLAANRFHIKVRRDEKPAVRFLKPTGEIEAVPTAEVHMRIQVADDFGVGKSGIVYQIDDGPEKSVLFENPSERSTASTLAFVLPLEDKQLTHQSSITYHAFVEDNRPEQPQRTITELQFIDIRPFKREFQLLKSGGS